MGEGKVLNQHYSPEFDPLNLPRVVRPPRNRRMKLRTRTLLPINIRCNYCGTHIYRGTKFSSRKEQVISETYLGIQMIRFYYKCICSAEITIKTDPQNSDYVVELGATRNFEPWRAEDEIQKREIRRKEKDAMKALKALQRTYDDDDDEERRRSSYEEEEEALMYRQI
ncbi:hypothetical protein GQ457_13G027780 [Hibiscus cannabinus]